MTHDLLNTITNSNGGGLSVAITGKYTSVRHERAKIDGKMTAGEAAKILTKELAAKISAKEVIAVYLLLNGRAPEWHHSGFYKGKNGSTMGRTFFFKEDEINDIVNRWDEIEGRRAAADAETLRKKETIITGYYYVWDCDYSGNYGKKRNYKVGKIYEGPEAGKPRNFTAAEGERLAAAKASDGEKYFGWDEPNF